VTSVKKNHTVGIGVGEKTEKSWKMRNGHYRTWNIARNTEKCGK
jgi:hypothetical protein